MFIYLATAAWNNGNKNRIKIGLCYGEEKNKRHSLLYTHGFDLVKKYDIKTYDIRGGEWVESTVQEIIKKNYGWQVDHIPNDRFDVNAFIVTLDIYNKFEEYVREAQELYIKHFYNAGRGKL